MAGQPNEVGEWYFRGAKGQRVSISETTATFDMLMRLVSPSLTTERTALAGGDELISFDAFLGESGIYTLQVSSLSGAGTYTISISLWATPTPTSVPN